MFSVSEEEEEIFYDTIDYLVQEDDLDYEIWLKEPQSVKERRDKFLSKMGFLECCLSESNSENLLDERRKSNSEANSSVDYSDQCWLDDISIDSPVNVNVIHQCQIEPSLGENENQSIQNNKKKAKSWWRNLGPIRKNERAKTLSRVRMEANRKMYMECTAIYARQELKGHDDLIRTMKFSPDGQYLASGGADGIVCVWRVMMIDADKRSFDMQNESNPRKKKSFHASVVIPEKIFHIEEKPLHKFQGHTSDVLDLAWSTSNLLLSSSMDKTVRLWQVGSDGCLGVFRHCNYVTCVQFNPVDEKYFISGSIDGKVRIWGIRKMRVVDWANARDIVTAVCYQPNGKGFVVGSFSGTCRFYELSGEIVLNAEINIHTRKKSSGNRITGIQFLKNDSQRVMITSEDSKIRILDGLEVVRKYKGLTKSGRQTSASFTPNGRHIVSVGDDSRIYLWNHDDLSIQTTRHHKSTRSCERFFSEGATIALPWSNSDMGNELSSYDRSPSSTRDSERFSLANWFSLDGSSRASITWPEEKLPVWDLPESEVKNGLRSVSSAWGLVFVTANCDGVIRTYHNYGLPVRI